MHELEQRVKLLEDILFKLSKSDRFVFERDIALANGRSIRFPVGTGGYIGKASTDKIGFWGKTPVVQQSSTGETTGVSAGAGNIVRHDSTIDGNTGSTAYTLSDIVKHLKTTGIIAS